MYVNSHTHLYSGLAPLGMPLPARPPRNFAEILQGVWWRLDRALDEASLRAAARYYVAHARRAETIALVDHHESPSFIEGSLDVLAEACEEFGMHAVLCYGATERNGGRDEARRGLEECRRFTLGNRWPAVRGVVGLHASFTVSDDTIRDAGRLCRELGTVLHVHVAEDRTDVEDARRRGFAGPLERLLALQALPPGSILAHGVHLTPEQVRVAADAGCWLVQNPRSNRNNRVGYGRALRATERVALGTDGFASDMREEARELSAIAAAEGDWPDPAGPRLAAGWEIARERLGLTQADALWREPSGSLGREPSGSRGEAEASPHTCRCRDFDFDSIEAEARAQAQRLWRRLESLSVTP